MTAYVPDGYVTSRGIKTSIDLKAAHHFWKVVGEVTESNEPGLPMVRGRSYQPQAPTAPHEHNLIAGSLLAEKATGALVFVKTIFDGEVAVEDENASHRRIALDQVTDRFDLVGHSADFEEEVALRA